MYLDAYIRKNEQSFRVFPKNTYFYYMHSGELMHYFKIQENIDSEFNVNIQNGKMKSLNYIEYSMFVSQYRALRRNFKENQPILKTLYQPLNVLVNIDAASLYTINMYMREYPITLPYWEHDVIGVRDRLNYLDTINFGLIECYYSPNPNTIFPIIYHTSKKGILLYTVEQHQNVFLSKCGFA